MGDWTQKWSFEFIFVAGLLSMSGGHPMKSVTVCATSHHWFAAPCYTAHAVTFSEVCEGKMMQNKWTKKVCAALIAAPLLLGSVPMMAQRTDRDHHDDHHGNFYQGARDGGRGGSYGGGYHHDERDYHQGGIGPGKGAAIGGIGGAVLGAAFGGGLKGAIIGGAAGAGIGAIAGKAHQDDQRRQYYNGRPY
jgi:hypothetical protein